MVTTIASADPRMTAPTTPWSSDDEEVVPVPSIPMGVPQVNIAVNDSSMQMCSGEDEWVTTTMLKDFRSELRDDFKMMLVEALQSNAVPAQSNDMTAHLAKLTTSIDLMRDSFSSVKDDISALNAKVAAQDKLISHIQHELVQLEENTVEQVIKIAGPRLPAKHPSQLGEDVDDTFRRPPDPSVLLMTFQLVTPKADALIFFKQYVLNHDIPMNSENVEITTIGRQGKTFKLSFGSSFAGVGIAQAVEIHQGFLRGV